MNTRIQLACIWCGPAFVATYFIFFWVIAGFIPPPSPTLGAEEIAAFFRDRATEIRIGQLGGMIASTLLFPWWVAISAQIARIEGGRRRAFPMLAAVQLCGGILLQIFFFLCSMLWITATFRAELDAATVRVLNDLSWLIFVAAFPAYSMQMVCIAVASLMDRGERPVWPRWMGYFTLWVSLSGAGGGLAMFFKTGPFAWNGLIGFYLALVVLVAWILTMAPLMHRAVLRQAAEDERETARQAAPVAA